MTELLTPNEWQSTDQELGINYPWYTNRFLDVLKTWDLSDKTIFEYGLGGSSLWFAHKCKRLYGVDNDEIWLQSVQQYLAERGLSATHFIETDLGLYPSAIFKPSILFDMVVVDGIERDECVPMALDRLRGGGILIIDNWQQPSVWMANDRTLRALRGLEAYVFKQDGHPDWQTAYFIK